MVRLGRVEHQVLFGLDRSDTQRQSVRQSQPPRRSQSNHIAYRKVLPSRMDAIGVVAKAGKVFQSLAAVSATPVLPHLQ
ncbi:hypothetical protein I551_5219 [Mycobacterium ulcerans str. Harvey]|uniref:Uncharacterized protein n=1 Tax=Mycobacterium ulcerans str. Harvey TaxID=1299332 RepID=A0ABN0QUI4_MYCUL|nr:hypothetical protein I551_5219 [Mycobacterium ulcerans str. Harvey]